MMAAARVRKASWMSSRVFFERLGGKQRCMHHAEAPVLETLAAVGGGSTPSTRRGHGQVRGDHVYRRTAAGGIVPAAAETGSRSVRVVSEP
jgi:hypothetical protein